MNYNIIHFQKHGDARGMLVALELMKEIPFEIKRIYFMYDTVSGVRRGYHSHKKLSQVLICVKGSCKIHLDDGNDTAEVDLSDPTKGLLIHSNIWREMYDFSKDAVLLVVASELYDEKDYIRDYSKFLKSVRGENNEN